MVRTKHGEKKKKKNVSQKKFPFISIEVSLRIMTVKTSEHSEILTSSHYSFVGVLLLSY